MQTVTSLSQLNSRRTEAYFKDPHAEEFLHSFNRHLAKLEEAQPFRADETFPTLFVFGLPRSGTSVLSQLIAYSLDVGYINNFAARFWRAPVTGLNLYRLMFPGETVPLPKAENLKSDYGQSRGAHAFHDFGYFWRYWLGMDSLGKGTSLKKIQWNGLLKNLMRIQHHFNRPVIFKNMFGAFHLKVLSSKMLKPFWIYIERNPVDTGVSIYKAKLKFYGRGRERLWWSIAPPEYKTLYKHNGLKQAAGQVYYLHRFFERQIEQASGIPVLRIQYRDLCRNPQAELNRICIEVQKKYGCRIGFRANPPRRLYRKQMDDQIIKRKIKKSLSEWSLAE